MASAGSVQLSSVRTPPSSHTAAWSDWTDWTEQELAAAAVVEPQEGLEVVVVAEE